MKVKTFEVILEKDEAGWFIADVPALPGCHTQGKTKSEALKNIKEAIELTLEVMAERDCERHENKQGRIFQTTLKPKEAFPFPSFLNPPKL